MKRRKNIKRGVLMAISFTLLLLVFLTLLLRYPLNLIVDAIFLGVIGIVAVLYVVIWSVLEDRLVVYRDHLSLRTHGLILWNTRDERIYFSEIDYFVKSGGDVLLVTRDGRVISVLDPVDPEGNPVEDLPALLRRKRVKRKDYEEHIGSTPVRRESYIGRI